MANGFVLGIDKEKESTISAEQTTTSTADGGVNVMTFTLGGETVELQVRNGSKGSTGARGATGPQGPQGEKGEKGDPGDGTAVTVDTSLSSTSTNPLQNKAIYTALSDKLSKTGTAASATKLATSRAIQTNLANSSSASFNGTADISPGVTGILGIANGGTGNTGGYVTCGIRAGTTRGEGSGAHGDDTNAVSGDYSFAFGMMNNVSGGCSISSGYGCQASATYSVAIGLSTVASGVESFAAGFGTVAAKQDEFAIGTYNVESTTIGNRLIIGNGTDDARSNCFRVNKTAVFGGTYNSSGADYAEYFEWTDGNPNNEDRRGLFVVLNGGKIRLANSNDDRIIGIVSGDPSIIGDAHDDQWNKMYLSDIFGSPIFEDVEVPDVKDEEGNVLIPAHSERRQKLNPDYDNTQKYIPRSERPEWSAVGMMGKLVVVDDGSCMVDDWCRPSDGGIGTKSETRTRFCVMERLDERHIKILVL